MKVSYVFTVLLLLVLSACSDNQPQEGSFNVQSDQKNDESQTKESETELVTRATILQASSTGWRSHGRTYSEQRYSPLTAINTDTVSELGF